MNEAALLQLNTVRRALNEAQHQAALLTRTPCISGYDSIIAAYQTQKQIAEAIKLLGFIEAEETK